MAVILDSKSTTDTAVTSTTSFTNGTNMTVGATANALVAAVTWGEGITPPSAISITWNGVAMTVIPGTLATNPSTGTTSALFGLINPAIGTHTFAGSWTTALDCCAALISFTGADNSSFANAFQNGTNTSVISGFPSIDIISVTGSMAVVAISSDTLGFTGTINGTFLFNDASRPSFTACAVYDSSSISLITLGAISNLSTDHHTLAGVNVSPPVTGSTTQLRVPIVTKLPPFKISIVPSQAYNPNLYSPANPVPFFNAANPGTRAHWSNQPDIPYNLNLYTLGPVSVPFTQFGPSPAFRVPSAKVADNPLNINLFTNPIPFNQTDWSKSTDVSHILVDLSVQLNQNLTNFFPFNQVSWPAEFKVPQAPFSPDQALNINLFTNPIPFNQFDYSKPIRVPHAPFYEQAFNPGIYSNFFPFNQFDWSHVNAVPHAPFYEQPFNPDIYSNPYPFNQYNWAGANKAVQAHPVDAAYNQNLYTVIVNTVPFNQFDFSVPFRPVKPPAPASSLNPNLFTNPIPFNQFSYPSVNKVPQAPYDLSFPLNLNIYSTLVLIPINQTDWSKPFKVPQAPFSPDQALNINLFTNPIPFAQYDFSITIRQKPLPAPEPPLNLNLYGPVTASLPFNQTDWAVAVRRQASAPVTLPLNINLFTNPLPFNQSDYSKPVNIPHAPFDLSKGLNLATFPVVPLPFNQYDYSHTVRIKITPPQPPYNLALYNVVVSTTLHIVKFIGNVGNFMNR